MVQVKEAVIVEMLDDDRILVYDTTQDTEEEVLVEEPKEIKPGIGLYEQAVESTLKPGVSGTAFTVPFSQAWAQEVANTPIKVMPDTPQDTPKQEGLQDDDDTIVVYDGSTRPIAQPQTDIVTTPVVEGAPQIIRINSSVPNDGRAYYGVIIRNGHTEFSTVFKHRNRQIVEIGPGPKYEPTKTVVDPDSFMFIRTALDTDFR